MTTGSLLSPHWYRVAYLRPRLKSGVRISRQRVRGRVWYVLTDAVSGRHHRFDDQAYALVAACDGRATVDDVWARRVDALGDAAPTQAQAIEVFARAFSANVLDGDVAADARALMRAERRRRAQRRRLALNPLSFKLPLWNPGRFLDAHVHRVGPLFSAAGLLAIAVLMLAGLVLMIWNAAEFSRAAATQLGQGRVLILLWVAYPIVKLVHELAHAFAVKRFGGEVPEIGVALLMLTPVPYVDASASAAFESRHERVIVGAAGIAAEWLIASAALALWALIEPGFVRDLAFAFAVVAGISTLVVNANPLLRFDGYHVLCDAFELPNLAARSSRWWHGVLQRLALGRWPEASTEGARGRERAWLVFYAPASWFVRGVLTLALALALADWQPWLGLLVLLLGAWWMLAAPVFAALRWMLVSVDLHGARARALGSGAVAAAAAFAFACFTPLPDRTSTPGVVWLPDEAIVRTQAEGFIGEILVRDGQQVAAGTLLLRLDNDTLRQSLVQVSAELELQRIEQLSQRDVDPLRAAQAGDRVAALETQAQELGSRVASLDLRADIAGRVAIDPQRVVAGRWLARGQTAAHVLTAQAPRVRALVAHDDMARLREQPGAIRVTLAHADGESLPAQWLRGVPRASTQLLTPALGAKAGGPLALDPADAEGRTTLEPRFEVELSLPEGAAAHVGARAWVRFDHGDATLAEISSRFLRRSFLRHFAT